MKTTGADDVPKNTDGKSPNKKVEDDLIEMTKLEKLQSIQKKLKDR